MIDVVIPVSETNTWEFNDLRFCLRSIHKHLKYFGAVHIVTDYDLDFLKPTPFGTNRFGFNVIKLHDTGPWKEQNIHDKIVQACKNREVSKEFLLMNDDHFLIRDTSAALVPYYFDGTIEKLIYQRQGLDMYKECLINTYFELIDKGLPTKYFDVHTPIVYDKVQYLACTALNWKEKAPGFVIKSLYANSLRIEGFPYKDAKIELMPDDFRAYLSDKQFFSVGSARALKNKILPFLEELYPEKSPWEI